MRIAAYFLVFALGWHGVAQSEGPWLDNWGALLAEFTAPATSEGIAYTSVDYEGLRKSEDFKRLLGQLAAFKRPAEWPLQEQKAFWINAYNIATVAMVANHRDTKSIRNLTLFGIPVWFRPAITLQGETFDLWQIEHAILRPMGDPRIHAAINCASFSCPDLLARPYTAATLDQQLNDQAAAFLAAPSKGMLLDLESETLRLSPLFRWFQRDFGGKDGVLDFIERHHPMAAMLPADWRAYRVRYFRYNWGLNRPGPKPELPHGMDGMPSHEPLLQP